LEEVEGEIGEGYGIIVILEIKWTSSMHLQHTAVLVPAGDRELQANPLKNRKLKKILIKEGGTPVGNTMYDSISIPSS